MAHHRQEFGPDEPDIPLYAGLPDQPGELPAQAGARRHRADRVQAVPRTSSPASARPTPRVRHTLLEDPAGAGGAARRRDRRRRVVGVPGVLGAAVPHRVAGDQPAPLDRRARRHGRVDRPARHDALRPPVVVVAHVPRARSTSAGTSRTTSTPACRCATCPSTTGRCASRATSRPALEFPTYRALWRRPVAARNPAGNPAAGRRVRKLRAWSSGSRTLAAW